MAVISNERWRNNWLVVGPTGAVAVDLGRSSATKRRLHERSIRELPPATPVVLRASAPGAIRRCRRFAAEAGIELEREYLAFPSARSPAYLVEDAPATVDVFVKTALVTPPRTPFSTPIEACLGLLRALSPWRLIRSLAPGRVVVGRRR
jgi:hypothetical protein